MLEFRREERLCNVNALCNVEVTVYNAFPDIKTVTSKRISLLKIRGERERETGRWKNKLVMIKNLKK